MPWKEIVPQHVNPRCDAGVDYGRDRYVLAVRDGRYVEYRPGHTHWAGVGRTAYAPGALRLWTGRNRDGRYYLGHNVCEGQVTKAKLTAAAPAIAEFLGVPVSDLPPLDRNKTFAWVPR